MDATLLTRVRQLADSELISRVKELTGREREATTILIAHLAEVDRRRLYLAEGYSSLFTYCTQALRHSESGAYRRIESARVVRKFPIALAMLIEGSVNLTTLVLLAPHLTTENYRELLDAARHKSKQQIKELVARLCPQAPVSDSIRRMPAPPQVSSTSASNANALLSTEEILTAPVSAPTAPNPTAPRAIGSIGWTARPSEMTPLAPERYRIRFTASTETYEKLRQAQALLRHQIPNGDVGEIVDRALTVLLQILTKAKLAATDRPRVSRGTAPGSRHIPAEVRRTVWNRDRGRCAFVGTNGHRCDDAAFLEFHHVIPYAAGGQPTADNIQLRCRAHNGHEAELFFGQDVRRVRESSAVYLAAGPA